MKPLRPAATLLALGVLIWPELARYRAERRIKAATGAFRLLLANPVSATSAYAAFDRVTEVALSATPDLPGDPRPWIVAASSQLASGRPERSIELYREALARGERAEIHFNLGRAYSLRGDDERARAAWLRGGWVSPALLETIPPDSAAVIRTQIPHLEMLLRRGQTFTLP